MFALIKTGGKQYRVKKGDRLLLEKVGDADAKEMVITDVMMISDGTPVFGKPYIKGASVTAKILRPVRGEKVTIFKKKRRQNYRRKLGHRQDYHFVEITQISKAA